MPKHCWHIDIGCFCACRESCFKLLITTCDIFGLDGLYLQWGDCRVCISPLCAYDFGSTHQNCLRSQTFLSLAGGHFATHMKTTSQAVWEILRNIKVHSQIYVEVDRFGWLDHILGRLSWEIILIVCVFCRNILVKERSREIIFLTNEKPPPVHQTLHSCQNGANIMHVNDKTTSSDSAQI